MRLSRDFEVFGKRELGGVVTEELFARETNHLAERVINGKGEIVVVAKDHRRHVVLKGEAKSLLRSSFRSLALCEYDHGL